MLLQNFITSFLHEFFEVGNKLRSTIQGIKDRYSDGKIKRGNKPGNRRLGKGNECTGLCIIGKKKQQKTNAMKIA